MSSAETVPQDDSVSTQITENLVYIIPAAIGGTILIILAILFYKGKLYGQRCCVSKLGGPHRVKSGESFYEDLDEHGKVIRFRSGGKKGFCYTHSDGAFNRKPEAKSSKGDGID